MAITKIQSESLNLADTYAFTGTVTGAGETLKPAFFAYLNSDVNTNNAANVKLPCNVEVFDTDNKYDNTTNYRFTPTIAGKYLVFANIYLTSTNGYLQHGTLKIYKNGSQFTYSRNSYLNSGSSSNFGAQTAISWSGVIDMDTDDYLEVYGQGEGGGQASYFKGGTANQASSFGAFKVIE